MELTQAGRETATQLSRQDNLSVIDQAKLQALASAQTGRYSTVEELAEAVATEEIDVEMFSSLIDTYVSEGLLTTGGGMSPSPSVEGHAGNCSICGSGMVNQGNVGDTDTCLKCLGSTFENMKFDASGFSTEGIEVGPGEVTPTGFMDGLFDGIELKEGEISI